MIVLGAGFAFVVAIIFTVIAARVAKAGEGWRSPGGRVCFGIAITAIVAATVMIGNEYDGWAAAAVMIGGFVVVFIAGFIAERA